MVTAPLPLLLPTRHLDLVAMHGPDHLRPVFRAIRHGGADFLHMSPGGGPFRPGRAAPLIVVVGDTRSKACGVESFHRKTLRRLIAASRYLCLMVGPPDPPVYVSAARTAVAAGGVSMVIETIPERAAEWERFARGLNKRPQTVTSGGAA